jgi:ABC-type microcin C transport system permease subunit YejE
MNKTACIVIIGAIFLLLFIAELVILALATKKPIHIHGNAKVLMTLFVKKDDYLEFKKAAKLRGYDKIEPYIEELIKQDMSKTE